MESEEGQQPLRAERKRHVDAVARELERVEKREPHRHFGVASPLGSG
jgi:hypothetical protein